MSADEAVYRVDNRIAHTNPTAAGPWDPRLQHGSAPSSLICWAVENLPAPVPMRLARLTVDLMRPVPVAPLAIETEIVREGRKIQLINVRLLAGSSEVVRASALRIRVSNQELPARATTPTLDLPPPEQGAPPNFNKDDTPFLRGLDISVVRGSMGAPGPAAVWFRARQPIVGGAAISPAMRAAIAADFCNGVSSVLSPRLWTFINGDLTVSLGREPKGDWILLDAETWIGPDSVGIAAGRLADTSGYFGRAVQSIIFEKR
ncbi:MAG TPA: thioesterase family protein [Reyranellaceae bacterium]|nr:thioesterase family protein [Reyranellaceae bacterium]